MTVSLKGGNDEATRKGFRKGLRKSRFSPSRHAFEAGESKYNVSEELGFRKVAE